MASQQVLFAETIAGMKKAFKRKSYESDSDSEIESYTNRGHKLKKRARFAHKGQLIRTAGPGAYKEAVDFAGVRRSIIHRNPPLVDEDGYEIDSDDDDARVEHALLSAAELNPYANIRLEHILAPLTASTDLPSHPILSKPFTSKNLTELVTQSCAIMHKENVSLWEVRHLWTSLCGDGTWLPCETMIGSNDIDLYSDEHIPRHDFNLPKTGGDSTAGALNGEAQSENAEARVVTRGGVKGPRQLGEKDSADTDVSMADAGSVNKRNAPSIKDKTLETRDTNSKDQAPTANGQLDGAKAQDGDLATNADSRTRSDGDASVRKKREKESFAPSEDVQMQGGAESTINARPDLNGNQFSLTASDAAGEPLIHPMFLPPSSAKFDRDIGLPENEAEDIRRLLALYVQKQEEVCRGATKLHLGLLRAERLRKNVLHWAKAEAHCSLNRDMSDGEDWYDKEEWGLAEDLKKGQDEDDEDTATAGKKTRNRR